jgi:transcriptional regulator with XRE-family HTH domain
MTPGDYLRSLRLKQNRTLQSIATAYGCSVPYLSDLEKGHRGLPRTREHRKAIAGHYKADLNDLERLIAIDRGWVDLDGLSDEQRSKVASLVARLRAK